jgi:acetyl-CoA synthetase
VRVNEFAALLGILPAEARRPRHPAHAHVPELPITMLACARLGVIHSQVFGGFSGTACADRIVDSGSNVLITMDSYYRSGTLLDHKQNADIAVEHAAKTARRSTRCWSGSAMPANIPLPHRWLTGGITLSMTCSKTITAPGLIRNA